MTFFYLFIFFSFQMKVKALYACVRYVYLTSLLFILLFIFRRFGLVWMKFVNWWPMMRLIIAVMMTHSKIHKKHNCYGYSDVQHTRSVDVWLFMLYVNGQRGLLWYTIIELPPHINTFTTTNTEKKNHGICTNECVSKLWSLARSLNFAFPTKFFSLSHVFCFSVYSQLTCGPL